MFEITLQFMSQLIELIPGIIGLYVIFDFVGSLLFSRR